MVKNGENGALNSLFPHAIESSFSNFYRYLRAKLPFVCNLETAVSLAFQSCVCPSFDTFCDRF